LPDILRLKRRTSGAAGAPGSLLASEVAFNEVDETLWYGKGNAGGFATSIIPIAGSGAFPALGDGRWVKKTGDAMSGPLHISVADNVSGLLLSGATNGVRFVAQPGYFSFEGVDNTGVATYQPLYFGGSALTFGPPSNFQTTVTLGLDPVQPMEAVTLRYLQNNYSTNAQGDTRWVNITGDTMTGGLVIDTFASLQQPITWRTNLGNTPPPEDFSGSIGLSYWGQVEVDFFNNLSDTSPSRGYIWWQRMAGGSLQPLMQIQNSGSFILNRYNPADGTYLGQSLQIFPADGHVVVRNWLTVEASLDVGTSTSMNSSVRVNGAKTNQPDAPNGSGYSWLAGGFQRWYLGTDSYPNEDGTDIGTGLTLHRYSDTGGYLGSAFGVDRKSGRLSTWGGIGVGNLGIDFGGAVVTNPWDLTKHIQFHYAGYGLSVTTNRLNYVSPNSHTFLVSTTDICIPSMIYRSIFGWPAARDAQQKDDRHGE